MYRIWSEVSGLMGHRQAWLKSAGEIYETENGDEARKEAFRLNDTMARNSAAVFRYSVVETTGGNDVF